MNQNDHGNLKLPSRLSRPLITTLSWGTFLLLLVSTLPAHAMPPVRCNGRIQFRPCGEEFAGRDYGKHGSRSIQTMSEMDEMRPPEVALAESGASVRAMPRPANHGHNFARVAKQEFSLVASPAGVRGSREGRWRGIIEGSGLVHLELNIQQAGGERESWYMGSVRLDGGSTFFSFKAPVPQGSAWTWEIMARATA